MQYNLVFPFTPLLPLLCCYEQSENMYNAVQHYTFFKPVQPIQEDVYCVWFVVPQASRLLGFWPNLENNHLESLKRTRLFCLEEGVLLVCTITYLLLMNQWSTKCYP
ncbi:hypothetical protein NP493_215g07043 [Ridgeia piscesae]|uniref:Uncharacterized protein n=1 Tax=Ridgeia piscesae TaxID=27915 RepID=A0AAD9P0R1_RIDPI|nr:hypothetical protein NP493_215g07043 [Ridgeia piscesae]